MEQETKNLANVPPEKCFWVHNGPILRNLAELLSALKKMKKGTFVHHVNKEKNDFSKWIKEVFGDKTLASALEKTRTKEGLIRILKKEIG